MIIDCNIRKQSNMLDLELRYRLQPPRRRCAEHHAAIMYRLSKNGQLLDTYRPKINLRSSRKIKFRYLHRKMQKLKKRPPALVE